MRKIMLSLAALVAALPLASAYACYNDADYQAKLAAIQTNLQQQYSYAYAMVRSNQWTTDMYWAQVRRQQAAAQSAITAAFKCQPGPVNTNNGLEVDTHGGLGGPAVNGGGN